MPHQAGPDFFQSKKPWSKRKDTILAYYLTPYLAKIKFLKRPILIVDGFAGPGTYADGEAGSPLIICKAIELAKRQYALDCEAMLVEENKSLFDRLAVRVKGFEFAKPVHGSFLDQIAGIKVRAESESVLLYLDPFTPAGIKWSAVESIFQEVQRDKSIEVLLNLNATSFARRVFARVQPNGRALESVQEDGDDAGVVTDQTLDDIAGGDWWKTICKPGQPFNACVQEITERFMNQLRTHFREVVSHPIYAKDGDSLPKYWMVFGSRHPVTRFLMNDAMVKARDELAANTPRAESLFETRTNWLIPEAEELPNLVLELLKEDCPRVDFVYEFLGHHFGRFSTGDIGREITSLAKAGRINHNAPRGKRMNDQTVIGPIERKP